MDKKSVFLALFCAFGWSLAYPLIKVGYEQFQIESADVGGKILFAGIRFFFAGIFVLVMCACKRIKIGMSYRKDMVWLFLLAIVNTTFHYMFAYMGLGYNSSARSTILDSMGGFFLILLSVSVFADDKMTFSKFIGCVLGITGIVSINITPGVDFFEHITFRGDGMILLNALIPVLGVIFAAILLGEKLKWQYFLAVVMVAGGICFVNREKERKR